MATTYVLTYRKAKIQSQLFSDFESARRFYNRKIENGTYENVARVQTDKLTDMPISEASYVVKDTVVKWRVSFRGETRSRIQFANKNAALAMRDKLGELVVSLKRVTDIA